MERTSNEPLEHQSYMHVPTLSMIVIIMIWLFGNNKVMSKVGSNDVLQCCIYMTWCLLILVQRKWKLRKMRVRQRLSYVIGVSKNVESEENVASIGRSLRRCGVACPISDWSDVNCVEMTAESSKKYAMLSKIKRLGPVVGWPLCPCAMCLWFQHAGLGQKGIS